MKFVTATIHECNVTEVCSNIFRGDDWIALIFIFDRSHSHADLK